MFELNKIVIYIYIYIYIYPKGNGSLERPRLQYKIYVVLEMFKHLIKMAGVSVNTVNSCLPSVLPLLIVLHPKVIKHY